jgi:hypothetical protein
MTIVDFQKFLYALGGFFAHDFLQFFIIGYPVTHSLAKDTRAAFLAHNFLIIPFYYEFSSSDLLGFLCTLGSLSSQETRGADTGYDDAQKEHNLLLHVRSGFALRNAG